MNERESEFKSFEEAASALRVELENLQADKDFPATKAFEIASQVIMLKKGDETFESQKAGISKDLTPQRLDLAEKYRNAKNGEARRKIIDAIKTNLTNWLQVLEHR